MRCLAEAPGLLVAEFEVPSNSHAPACSARRAPGRFFVRPSGTARVRTLQRELFNLVPRETRARALQGHSQAVTEAAGPYPAPVSRLPSPRAACSRPGNSGASARSLRKRLAAFPACRTRQRGNRLPFDSVLWFGLNAAAGTPLPHRAHQARGLRVLESCARSARHRRRKQRIRGRSPEPFC